MILSQLRFLISQSVFEENLEIIMSILFSSACKTFMISVFTGDKIFSHNNPCFLCNKAIMNFLVSHTCKIRFRDVKTLYTVMYSYTKILNHD